MDLLTIKGSQEKRLSSFGLFVKDIADASPTIAIDQRNVPGRSGYVFAGATYQSKKIDVNGWLRCQNLMEFERVKDQVSGWLVDSHPFYIVKCLPKTELYGFETPGQKSGDVDVLKLENEPLSYGWKVIISESISYGFKGKSEAGLLYDFKITFVTAELPFGESLRPRNEVVNGRIPYQGTAECSQLESPWYLELLPAGTQGEFFLTIADRTFKYTSTATFSEVMRIYGVETTLNDKNINDRTNYEHFVLQPFTDNLITTNFRGTIRVCDLRDLYK